MLSILHIASDKSDIHRNEVSMIRIGTRKSKLALIQTELVKAQILKYFPNEKIEIVHVVTHGDKVLDKPLGEIGGKRLRKSCSIKLLILPSIVQRMCLWNLRTGFVLGRFF